MGKGTLIQVHDGGAEIKILVHLVIKVCSDQALGLDIEHLVALHRDADRSPGIQQALIDDPDPAQGVIDGIIHVLGKLDTSGRDVYRTLGYVEGIQGNLRSGG